jgi:tetratricopeptide (TPR) repeat protein
MLKRKANRSGESSNQPKKKTQAPFVGTEPWKLVFKDAHQAFKENKFKEAIALFTRALTLKPDQITILDCRAACYEKVNEKDLGLHDASSIIKAAPQDSRGYLRAGKLLSLQKKYDKAISIYNHGLIKVDPKDTRFAMLNTMKQQAEWAARPAAKFDPVVVLPYDVFSIVFSHLSFERRIQCTAVSQRWRTFALNWSGMWRDLEFGNHKVPQKTIKKYLQYAQGRHVRSFSIHYAPKNATASILNSLINENCQYVETLGNKAKKNEKIMAYSNLAY